MIVIDCEQGSPAWFTARCGLPTASNFDKIITTKGERSKSRDKYLYQLAGEIIIGKPEETYKNEAMQRGIELEAEARGLYEFITGNIVKKVGLCVEDRCGASPDGLVGEDGSIEIKCPSLAVHVSYLIEDKLPTDYFQQVQGQLFVTKRDWVDFISYFPEMQPLIKRVTPDVAFHEALKEELFEFCNDLENTVKKLKEMK